MIQNNHNKKKNENDKYKHWCLKSFKKVPENI